MLVSHTAGKPKTQTTKLQAQIACRPKTSSLHAYATLETVHTLQCVMYVCATQFSQTVHHRAASTSSAEDAERSSHTNPDCFWNLSRLHAAGVQMATADSQEGHVDNPG